jgi:hypothetical protein
VTHPEIHLDNRGSFANGAAMGRLAFALMLLVVTSCARPPDGPISIETDPYNSDVCPANRPTIGTLAVDGSSLGLRLADGKVHGTIWPYHWSARRENGTALLLDEAGSVAAGEGDEVEVAGTIGDDAVVTTCGTVRRVS